MKVLVVDDEAPARSRLCSMLESLGDYSVCGEAGNGQDALAMAEQRQPDVLLLDIRMPGMDGIETARHLQALEQPPAIIFTTAYNDYALQAFDAHAVDYLLKPVRQARLAEALQHARRLTRMQAASLQQAGETAAARERICVRVRGALQLIAVSEIRYFLADQKYVTVCTADGKVLIEETLKSLEQEFAEDFVRVHRNALVAKRYLKGMDKSAAGHARVQLDGVDESLEVSRRHLTLIRKLIRALQA